MKYVRPRHSIIKTLISPIVALLFKALFGFRAQDKYKIKKNESILLLSNHQTDYDPILASLSFDKPIYYVTTDSIFSIKFLQRLLAYCFFPIPKKKGTTDINCIKTIMKIGKEDGSIGLFVEGNRTYAEFQFYIGMDTVKLIRALQKTVVFYNIHGGTGIMPRFFNKRRKGKFYGTIKKVLKFDEYKNMSDEELLQTIKDNLKVFDSESGEKYLSDNRAEYLERMLFVCPKCNSIQTLNSKGNFVKCSHCGLEVEYTEDLHLKSEDKDFKFSILNDWYQFQKQFLKNKTFKDDEIIFMDDDVRLLTANSFEKRKLYSKGKMLLTNKELKIGSKIFLLKDITNASPISGKRLSFTYGDQDYLIKGKETFNPLKYCLIFNKLDTYIKEHNLDKFYNLD